MAKLTTLKSSLPTIGKRLTTMAPGSWRTSASSSNERGYGYAWQKARAAYLRAHPLCVMCEAEGRVTAATVVDHRIAHRGDRLLFWDSDNWCALCDHHHSSDAQRRDNENDSRSGGWK